MESIKKIEDIAKLKYNKIEHQDLNLENSEIIFEGKNNILFCESNVKIKNSKIKFEADNSLVYLSRNQDNYLLFVSINNNSVLYIGENNYINNIMTLIISEEKNIVIGSDCLFSYGITFRTADPHLIYDYKTKKRTNYSKSIYIGDHVWIGQDSLLLKGTEVGSGSILAAGSICGNKKIPSNEIWGGNPVKNLKKNICWTRECVHKWTQKNTKQYETLKTDEYYYKDKNSNQSINKIEKLLINEKEAKKKIKIIKNELKKNDMHLFSIKAENKLVKKIKNNQTYKRLRKLIKKR